MSQLNLESEVVTTVDEVSKDEEVPPVTELPKSTNSSADKNATGQGDLSSKERSNNSAKASSNEVIKHKKILQSILHANGTVSVKNGTWLVKKVHKMMYDKTEGV